MLQNIALMLLMLLLMLLLLLLIFLLNFICHLYILLVTARIQHTNFFLFIYLIFIFAYIEPLPAGRYSYTHTHIYSYASQKLRSLHSNLIFNFTKYRLSFPGLPPLPQSLSGMEINTLNNTSSQNDRGGGGGGGNGDPDGRTINLDNHLAILKREMVSKYNLESHLICIIYTILSFSLIPVWSPSVGFVVVVTIVGAQ